MDVDLWVQRRGTSLTASCQIGEARVRAVSHLSTALLRAILATIVVESVALVGTPTLNRPRLFRRVSHRELSASAVAQTFDRGSVFTHKLVSLASLHRVAPNPPRDLVSTKKNRKGFLHRSKSRSRTISRMAHALLHGKAIGIDPCKTRLWSSRPK